MIGFKPTSDTTFLYCEIPERQRMFCLKEQDCRPFAIFASEPDVRRFRIVAPKSMALQLPFPFGSWRHVRFGRCGDFIFVQKSIEAIHRLLASCISLRRRSHGNRATLRCH